MSFVAAEYKPDYKILIPVNYKGEVILILSNEKINDFNINENGIGYVCLVTYNNGFNPIVIQNGNDRTKEITSPWGYCTSQYTDINGKSKNLIYLTFKMPEEKNDIIITDFDELIKIKAIDTTRIKE